MLRSRVLAWVALSVMALLGVAIYGVSGFFMDMVLHPPRQPPPGTPATRGPPTGKPPAVGRPPQPLGFYSAVDQIHLTGWFIPPINRAQARQKPAVLLVHGRGANKSAVVEYMPWLHQAGYAVAALDLRAHGESDGKDSTMGLYEPRDVRGAMRVLSRMGYARVAPMGFSMGATTVLMTAAQKPPGLVGVIAEAGFMDLPEVLRHNGENRFGKIVLPFTWLVQKRLTVTLGQDPATVNIARRWPRTGGPPALIIQSERDDLVPPANARRIARAIGKKAQLYICPGSSHVKCHADHPKTFEKKVLDFLASLN